MVSTNNLIRTWFICPKLSSLSGSQDFYAIIDNLMLKVPFFSSITFYAVAQLESKYIHIFSNPDLNVKVRPRALASTNALLYNAALQLLISQVDFAIQFSDDVTLYCQADLGLGDIWHAATCSKLISALAREKKPPSPSLLKNIL